MDEVTATDNKELELDTIIIKKSTSIKSKEINHPVIGLGFNEINLKKATNKSNEYVDKECEYFVKLTDFNKEWYTQIKEADKQSADAMNSSSK